MADPTACDGAEQAVDGSDGAGDDARGGDGVSSKANEEGGQECGDAAYGEGPHGHAERCRPECGIACETDNGGSVQCGLEFIGGSALRFLDEEPEGGGDEHSGQCSD